MTYFIINPAAGAGKGKAAVPIIDEIMRGSGVEYSFIYTESSEDYLRIAHMINFSVAKTIICVGGDGTIQEFAGLAVGRNVSYGVIPAGSAIDLLYSLPSKRIRHGNFKDKIAFHTRKVIEGTCMQIDAVSVNGVKYFLNIGGTGIDIQVLRDALPLKRYFAGGAYFLSLIKNTVTGNAEEMTLTVDGISVTDRYLLMAVSNGAYYGGHMRVTPPAVINDGRITLCKIKAMPRLKMIALFSLVKPGWHSGIKEVSFIDCRSVKIEYNGRKWINLDGNLYEFESPLTFDMVPGAVRFII